MVAHAPCLHRDDLRIRQEAHQIDEVAGLADDAAAAAGEILRPVLGRNGPGIHGHDERLRFVQLRQQRLHLGHLRGEAPVEAHHQVRGMAGRMRRRVGGSHLGDLFQRQRQWLFDKHMLLRAQCLDHQGSVRAVAGGHGDQVDARVAQHLVDIRRSLGKALRLAVDDAAHATGGHHAVQLRAGLPERRHQHPRGVVAGADEGTDRLRGIEHRRRIDQRQPARERARWRRLVLQHDAQRGLVAAQQVIRARRLVEGNAVRDQRAHVESAVGQHIEHRLEIALLGPAHEAQRIVPALLLIRRVVAARPVRARHLERQLLLVEVRPIQLQPRHAHQHDAAALAAHLRGLGHRLARRGGCRDDDAVHAPPAAERQPGRDRILAQARIAGFRPELRGQLQLLRVEIDGQHAAAVGTQQLHGQQADQAHAGHDEGLAQRGFGQADALQPDGRDDGEDGGFVVDLVRNARTEIAGHAHHIGVRAVRHDPVADLEALHARPHGVHRSDVAVAQRNRLVQLRADRAERGGQAIGGNLVEHHLDLFRLLPRLGQQRGAAEVHQHAFGAGGDQRGPRRGNDRARTGRHARGLHDIGRARAEILQNLSHD